MIVSELIQKLQSFDPTAEVKICIGSFNGVRVKWPSTADIYVQNEPLECRRLVDDETGHPRVELLCYDSKKLQKGKR